MRGIPYLPIQVVDPLYIKVDQLYDTKTKRETLKVLSELSTLLGETIKKVVDL